MKTWMLLFPFAILPLWALHCGSSTTITPIDGEDPAYGQCPAALVCTDTNNGKAYCLKPETMALPDGAMPCAKDQDCPTLQVCETKSMVCIQPCIPVETEDGDSEEKEAEGECPEGQACYDVGVGFAVCLNETYRTIPADAMTCEDSMDCPVGQVCDVPSSKCVKPCNLDDDADEDGDSTEEEEEEADWHGKHCEGVADRFSCASHSDDGTGRGVCQAIVGAVEGANRLLTGSDISWPSVRDYPSPPEGYSEFRIMDTEQEQVRWLPYCDPSVHELECNPYFDGTCCVYPGFWLPEGHWINSNRNGTCLDTICRDKVTVSTVMAEQGCRIEQEGYYQDGMCSANNTCCDGSA